MWVKDTPESLFQVMADASSSQPQTGKQLLESAGVSLVSIHLHQESSPKSTISVQWPLQEHMSSILTLNSLEMTKITLVSDNARLLIPPAVAARTSPQSSARPLFSKSVSDHSVFLPKYKHNRWMPESAHVANSQKLLNARLLDTPAVAAHTSPRSSTRPLFSKSVSDRSLFPPKYKHNRWMPGSANVANSPKLLKQLETLKPEAAVTTPEPEPVSRRSTESAPTLPRRPTDTRRVYLRQESDSALIRPERRGSANVANSPKLLKQLETPKPEAAVTTPEPVPRESTESAPTLPRRPTDTRRVYLRQESDSALIRPERRGSASSFISTTSTESLAASASRLEPEV
jgi:hypothetical protein